VVQGSFIVIRQEISFEQGSDVIAAGSYPVLRAVRTVLVENPDIAYILIEGHTSLEGNVDYNWDLSNKRARSVFRYLVEQGVNSERLSYRGMGEAISRTAGRRGEIRREDRRVEFRILTRLDPWADTIPDWRGVQPPIPWRQGEEEEKYPHEEEEEAEDEGEGGIELTPEEEVELSDEEKAWRGLRSTEYSGAAQKMQQKTPQQVEKERLEFEAAERSKAKPSWKEQEEGMFDDEDEDQAESDEGEVEGETESDGEVEGETEDDDGDFFEDEEEEEEGKDWVRGRVRERTVDEDYEDSDSEEDSE
jgi:hypothetical protein